VRCSRCGAEGPEGARFCPSCGAPLAVDGVGERKVATMLFADVVGSTALASGRDPEDVRARLERYFAVAREVLDAHGGTVEKFIGDAVLAIFGAPRSHGDDPDRAVRAGLELVDRVGELGLGLRVGIATGEVLAAGPGADLAVAGEAVNAAARVQQGAPAGGVLVDARTAGACRAVALEPAGDLEAKGFETPIAVFAATAAPGEVGRLLRDTPLVGRDDDLALLRLVVRRAFSARAPALVTLVGEAGLGKTRLANELVRTLVQDGTGVRVLEGVSPPYGRGIAFWALAEIVRSAAGTTPDAPAMDVRSALADVLRGRGAPDADEVADGLGLALGAGDDSGTRADDRVRRAWRRLLAILAGERPLLLVLDDIHWADEGLLDLVEEIAGGLGELPLVAVCTARPELLDVRPGWAGGLRGATAVDLRPLGADDARALADVLLGPSGHALADRVAELAGGNPFFTEEVARRLAEAADEVLPDTVQGAVAARIDLLPDDEKLVVQRAAVLGATFSEDGLRALLDADPAPALRGLARREIVVELSGEGPGIHGFRHQLLRDVAYRSLPRAARAELHERAAEWVAASAGERMAELSELVAFHREQAAVLERSEGRELAAIAALREAAEHVERRGAVEGAQALLERAAGVASAPGVAADCLRAAAEAALGRMRGDLAIDLLLRAADLDEARCAVDLASVVELYMRMRGITGPPPDADELAALLARARASAVPGDRVAEAWIEIAEVWAAEEAEDVSRAERGLELARAVDDPVLLSSAFDAVAGIHQNAGRPGACLRATRQRAALTGRLAGHRGRQFLERRDHLYMLSLGLTRTGALREALAVIEQSRETEWQAAVDYGAFARGVDCLFLLGEWDRVVEDLESFVVAWEAARTPTAGFLRMELAIGSLLHGLRGDHAGWARWRDILTRLDTSRPEPDRNPGAALLILGDAAIDLHFGRPNEAAARLGRAPSEIVGWIRSTWGSVRAEAFVRAGDPGAGRAIAEAEAVLEEDAIAAVWVLRARALHAGDEALLREARESFARLEVPYELARTQLDLGGADAEEGRATYRRLGLFHGFQG
jgi:class 3 adenylate cyclase